MEHTPRLGFWPHQFPASWSHGPLRSGTAQAPTHQTCSLCTQPASCTAHLPELPAQDPRSSIYLYLCLRFEAEAYTRRATDNYTGTNFSRDHRRGLRLLRGPISLHTPLLTEPERPSRDSLDYGNRGLGAHVGAPSW